MPYGLKDIELAKLNEVFAANKRIERVVLYGSRAKGNYKPFSDVDITLEGDELTHTDLSRLSLAIDDLLLPYQFDISIFHTLKNEALIDHIRRMGITIFEKKSEWKEYKFSDFVEINPSVKIPKGIPVSFVEMKDLDSSVKYCESSQKKELTGGSRFINGDTLFARITPCMENGKICQVRNLENGFGFGSTEFHILRGKDGVSDSDFVYYLSRWDEVRDHAEHNMEGSSGRQRVPKQAFDSLILSLPPLPTQRRIAAILSSLDDKIDLLHRENATLEQMAETMFRQWFVVEAKEKWEEGKLGDILSVKGGTTPSTKEPSFWDGDIAWTSPRDVTTLNGLYLFETEKRITQKGLEQISSGLLPSGTLLMSSRAPVGVLAFAEIPLAINQGYIAIIDDKGYPKEFIYLWLKANMDLVHSYSNGSTFMEISKSAFKSLDISIPSKNEVECFVQEVKPYFEKIRTNEIQIRTLTKTRDGSLPKLMSNEINIR